jgi:hypothetical protein
MYARGKQQGRFLMHEELMKKINQMMPLLNEKQLRRYADMQIC